MQSSQKIASFLFSFLLVNPVARANREAPPPQSRDKGGTHFAIPPTPSNRSELSRENSQVILNGRRTESLALPFKESVVCVFGYDERENLGNPCSGTIVEGCIVTARHCLRKNVGIYSGTDMMNEAKRKKLSTMGEARYLGDKKNDTSSEIDPDDLAIIKPATPIPKELWQSRSIFADKAFEGTPHSTNLSAIGWGVRETTEVEKDDVVTREDRGSLQKRYGEITYAGTLKGTLKFNRANSSQALAAGDSGGPVFKRVGDKVTLVGVAHAGQKRSLENSKESQKAEDSIGSYAVDVATHKKWLDKTLDELKCGSDAAGDLVAFVHAELGANGDRAVQTWDNPKFNDEALIKKFRELVKDHPEVKKQLEDIPSVGLRVTEGTNGAIEIHWSARWTGKDPVEESREYAQRKGLSVLPRGTISIPKRED